MQPEPTPPVEVPPVAPLLTFHVISDVHMARNALQTPGDLAAALTDLHSVDPYAHALVINGDLTDRGRPDDYTLLTETLAANPHPATVFQVIGNHEYHTDEPVPVMRQRYLDYVSRDEVYFHWEVFGYPFVFCGMEDIVATEQNPPSSRPFNAVLSEAQLDWLDGTLAHVTSAARPTFLFCHHPVENIVQRDRFSQIVSAHPNVIYFWGHWHTDLTWYQRGPDPRLFRTSGGCTQISEGAVYYMLEPYRENGQVKQRTRFDMKQGVHVQVYADHVRVRGRDLAARTWLPQFDHTIALAPLSPPTEPPVS